jgi:hypothetical protein
MGVAAELSSHEIIGMSAKLTGHGNNSLRLLFD